jgi:2,3-dihydro-2,3-dihydroxybenzoate dehydrogenase
MTTDGISGRVAVVTGAAAGIGAAVARVFATAGATVAAIDRDGDRLADVVDKITADAGHAYGFTLDLTDSSAVSSTVDAIEARVGPIGILVNVAGILRPGPAVEITDEDWAATFAVNTTGVFATCRAVAAAMIPRRRGCLVTVGSNAAGMPRTNMAAYAASKAAAVQFTRCLGLELAGYGIRCNVVSPGSTDTDMQRSLWPDPADDAGAAAVIAGDQAAYRIGIPLGRIASAQDIAEAVLFLASDRAKHITLQDLYVDGGATPRC